METRMRGLICTVTGFGLASMALLCLGNSGLTLEPPPQRLAQVSLNGGTIPQGNMVFVNSAVGDEAIGNGSKNAPFKTITQALQLAKPNSVIVLATGTYSTSSGETFPLMLKPGVSIQGDPRTRGRNIVIQGGGTFLSPTFARQNITILGANQASLSGVTVTNTNPRGYGLWIESSNPVVTDNTFTGNDHDGISITGNSAPTIRSNYFYQNGANGMTIYGTSRPEVRENVFEKTGFGINIAQKAAPVLIGNRITQNLDGIVAQAKAQPILRGNVIEQNTRDGVVAIAQALPDLGTATEPGSNVFRQNGRHDINNSTSSQVIPAFGNQLAKDSTIGSIDLAGRASPVATSANQTTSNRQLAQNSQIASINNEAKEVLGESSGLGTRDRRLGRSAAAIPSPQTASIPNSPNREAAPAPATMNPIVIPVPPPAATAQVLPTPSRPPQKLSFLKITSLTPNQSGDSNRASSSNTQPASGSDTAIEIPVPPSPSKPIAPPPAQRGDPASKLPVLKPAPIVASELLPVPGANIPMGNNRDLPKASVPQNSLAPSAGSPPLTPTGITALALRYRVVVAAESESKQALVRSLVPGAFRTFSNGRVLMQVGAFSDRAKANEILQMLNSKGLRATVEQIN